jgi:hypothetical protein
VASPASSDRHARGTKRHAERRVRLNLPHPCRVEPGPDGLPATVDGRAVEGVRERWLIDEGWWTDSPVRRSYHELVLEGGRLTVIFEDLRRGGWYRQRD